MKSINVHVVLVISIAVLSLIFAANLRYDSYPGYKLKSIPNSTAIIAMRANILNEIVCLSFCIEELCTAVAFNSVDKSCRVNYYGRVILEEEQVPETLTWIKCKLHENAL